MTIVIRYHCDGCGQFIKKGRVVLLRDPFSGVKGHYHFECAKDIAPSRPVYTQEMLKV